MYVAHAGGHAHRDHRLPHRTRPRRRHAASPWHSFQVDARASYEGAGLPGSANGGCASGEAGAARCAELRVDRLALPYQAAVAHGSTSAEVLGPGRPGRSTSHHLSAAGSVAVRADYGRLRAGVGLCSVSSPVTWGRCRRTWAPVARGAVGDRVLPRLLRTRKRASPWAPLPDRRNPAPGGHSNGSASTGASTWYFISRGAGTHSQDLNRHSIFEHMSDIEGLRETFAFHYLPESPDGTSGDSGRRGWRTPTCSFRGSAVQGLCGRVPHTRPQRTGNLCGLGHRSEPATCRPGCLAGRAYGDSTSRNEPQVGDRPMCRQHLHL